MNLSGEEGWKHSIDEDGWRRSFDEDRSLLGNFTKTVRSSLQSAQSLLLAAVTSPQYEPLVANHSRDSSIEDRFHGQSGRVPYSSNNTYSQAERDSDDSESAKPNRSLKLFYLGQASTTSCVINLTNTTIGSGMLGLPYVFAKCGWVVGGVLVIIGAVLSAFSLHLLSICAAKNPPASIRAIIVDTFTGYGFLVDTAVILQCVGCCISYLVVIANAIPDVMIGNGATKHNWIHRQIWVIISFAGVAPLCFFEELDTLKYTSAVSVILAACIAIIMLLFALDISSFDPCENMDDGCSENAAEGVLPDPGVLQVFSIVVFAFACQPVRNMENT